MVGLAGVERIPRLSGSKLSYTEICYNILLHPLPSSPYRLHTKNARFTKTLCSQYYGKSKQPCRNVCIWSSGEYNGWPVNCHEPLDTTTHSTRNPTYHIVDLTLISTETTRHYPHERWQNLPCSSVFDSGLWNSVWNNLIMSFILSENNVHHLHHKGCPMHSHELMSVSSS